MSLKDDNLKKKKTKPSDILAEYGTWIWRTDFKKIVAKKLDISERRALDHIAKDPLVRAEKRQGGRVYYGLKTWPMKEDAKISAFFIKQAWEELAKISELNERTPSYNDSYKAWLQLCGFIARLPQSLKKQLNLDKEDAEQIIKKIFEPFSDLYTSNPFLQNTRVRVVVRRLIDKVSTALHSVISIMEP